jgi:hypothetical protein
MNFSVKIMAAGNVVSSMIALFINTYYTKKLSSYGILMQIRDISPYLFLSILSCLPAFVLCGFYNSNALMLIASIILSVFIYILLSEILKVPELSMIFNSLSKITNKRV